MGRKDTPTKSYMKDNAHFADVFNVALFGGEQKIRPEDLIALDPVEIGLVPSRSNLGKTALSMQKVRDIMKQAIVRDGKDCRYILLGIENQSDIHYAMPVKCLIYDALNYLGQVEKIAEENRKSENTSCDGEKKSTKRRRAEYLSGLKKEDRILPVITLVVYWGSEEWDGPRRLHEMFEGLPQSFLRYVPDYQINLLAPRECDKLDMFTTQLGDVMRLIAVSYDKNKLLELVEGQKKTYENLPMAEVRLVNEFTNLNVRKTRGKETGNVCKAVEDIKEEAMEKERTSGIRILIESLREVGLTSGAIAQKVQEKYGLSAKDVAMFL